jgi:hypothetical protein
MPSSSEIDLPAPPGETSKSPGAVGSAALPKLFSGGQLLVAALFGLPVAVALLMSLNFRRLNEPRRANLALAIGVVLSLIVVIAVAVLPESWARLMPLTASLGMWQWARHAQRAALQERARIGGGRERWWRALAYAGAVALATTVVAAGVYATFGIESSNYVALGDDRKVFYGNGATEEQARTLGELLITEGALPSGVTRIYLARSGAEYAVSIVLSEKWDDSEVLQHYGQLRRTIEAKAFAPARIRLCNQWLWPKQLIGP